MIRDKVESYHKRFITVYYSNGIQNKPMNYSIKRIIPMIRNDEVYDVEILLQKNNNTYFSINCYLKNKSWVKKIELSQSIDQRLTKIKPIANYIDMQMKSRHYSQVLSLLTQMVKK